MATDHKGQALCTTGGDSPEWEIANLRSELRALGAERAQLTDALSASHAELTKVEAERFRLRTDKERLDWIEARLRDEPAWQDIVIAHDWEDGVWLSLIERGSYNGARPLDEAPKPLSNIREAIDAARAAVPDACRTLREETLSDELWSETLERELRRHGVMERDIDRLHRACDTVTALRAERDRESFLLNDLRAKHEALRETMIAAADESAALRAEVARLTADRETLNQAVEDALFAMREPMTLGEARKGRAILTSYSVRQAIAAARTAAPTPTTQEG